MSKRRGTMSAAELLAWKKYRRLTNRDLAALTGLSESSIDKKLNGRTPISTRMPLELGNIDKLIAAGIVPVGCPEKLASLILAKRVR